MVLRHTVCAWSVFLFSFLRLSYGFAAVTFTEDDGQGRMLLSNAYYEVGFSRTHGAITHITDKSVGQTIITGSSDSKLWVLETRNGTNASSTDYTSMSPGFGYSWSATTKTLILTYQPSSSAISSFTATVTVIASDQNYFDIKIEVTNNSGEIIQEVLMPYGLLVPKSILKEVLIPENPGMALKQAYFTTPGGNGQYRGYGGLYPPIFNTILSLDTTQGFLSTYAMWDWNPPNYWPVVRPVALGIKQQDPVGNEMIIYYAFQPWTHDGQTYTSSKIRFRVADGFVKTIKAYRTDNLIDTFPSLVTKLGKGTYFLPHRPREYLQQM